MPLKVFEMSASGTILFLLNISRIVKDIGKTWDLGIQDPEEGFAQKIMLVVTTFQTFRKKFPNCYYE